MYCKLLNLSYFLKRKYALHFVWPLPPAYMYVVGFGMINHCFCGISKAKHHIRITLSIVHMSVGLSDHLSVELFVRLLRFAFADASCILWIHNYTKDYFWHVWTFGYLMNICKQCTQHVVGGDHLCGGSNCFVLFFFSLFCLRFYNANFHSFALPMWIIDILICIHVYFTSFRKRNYYTSMCYGYTIVHSDECLNGLM